MEAGFTLRRFARLPGIHHSILGKIETSVNLCAFWQKSVLDERGLLAPSTRLSARLQDARLHGCRAFGELSGSLFGELSRAAEFTEDRAVVERRLSAAGREQAAGEARSRPQSLRCHSGARPPTWM